MMNLSLLLVILFGVVTVYSLHAQQVYNQLEGYDIKLELQKLQAQQAVFESNLERMIQNVQSISNRAKQANSTEKVLLLENSILRQRQEIYSLSTQMLPPFNISKCSCQSLTDKEKVLVLSDLEITKKNVENVQQTIRKVPRCQKTDALNKDIQKQLFFVQSMQDIIYAKCLKVLNLSPTIFQTNLYVNNWILGDQTADQVVDQYYKRSLKYRNTTNCPISTPFFDGKECIACFQPLPIFNIFQRKCISCGSGGIVDKKSRRCVSAKTTYKNNYDAPNYSLQGLEGPLKHPQNAVQTCPLSNPFFDGIKCISCPSSTYFSVINRVCKNCPSGQVFNANQKRCIQGQIVQPVVSTPNIESNGKFTTNFDASNFIVPLNRQFQQFKSQEQQRINNDAQVKICPIQTPYSNGQKCFNCQRAPFLFFNLQTKKCTKCPPHSTYNFEQKRCLASQITASQTIPITPTQPQTFKPIPVTTVPLGDQHLSNLENNFWITNDGDVTKVFDHNRKKRSNDPNIKMCPIETPFFNGQACISCPSYFNFDTNQCSGCRIGTSFNPNLHICQITSSSTSAAFQTNPSKAPNLIYDGISYEQYKNNYDANISNNPNIQDCDQQTPYWNGKQCIVCPSDRPYFNLDSKTCQNCSAGSVYNAQSRECQDNEGKYINQGPTIQKLIAGLI